MERKRLLELAGYKVETMWECEWNELKSTLPNKDEIADKTRKQNIRTRDVFLVVELKLSRLTLNAINTKHILRRCLQLVSNS